MGARNPAPAPRGGLRRAAVVFVPGLTRALVDRGAFPTLESWLARTPSAGVVPSFPCLAPVVQASVLCGQLPREHGVLGGVAGPTGRRARPEAPTLFDQIAAQQPAAAWRAIGLAIDAANAAGPPAAAAPAAARVRWDDPAGALADDARAQQFLQAWSEPATRLAAVAFESLAASLHRAGLRDASTIAAARAADGLLAEILAHRPQDGVLLICGAPAHAPVRAGIPVSELASRCGALFHACEGSVARLRLSASASREFRDQLLATPGIERILDGDASASWGLPPPAPSELVVLAEPGWAFQEPGQPLPAACAGHPDASDEDEPLALWWGEATSEPWPARVHDYRLGATLAHAIGLATAGLRDRPLSI